MFLISPNPSFKKRGTFAYHLNYVTVPPFFKGRLGGINLAIDNSSAPIEEWIKNAELHKKGMTLLENKLLVDYVADLQALYYLSIDQHQYSENYMFRFKYFQNEAKYNDLSEYLDHLLSKSTFLEELLKSLLFLNQRDLAERIIQIYDLETIFDFISQARLGKFFKHFELLGY